MLRLGNILLTCTEQKKPIADISRKRKLLEKQKERQPPNEKGRPRRDPAGGLPRRIEGERKLDGTLCVDAIC